MVVGDGFNWEDGSVIYATYGGKVIIGNKVSTGRRMFISSGINSNVKIGDDCMFSHDISIHGTNEHSILDLSIQESITRLQEKPIEIGKHVWLGKNSTILYDTVIGNNTIVGACSLLKGVYPKNSIIAGTMGRVIREKVTWDRRKDIEFSEFQ